MAAPLLVLGKLGVSSPSFCSIHRACRQLPAMNFNSQNLHSLEPRSCAATKTSRRLLIVEQQITFIPVRNTGFFNKMTGKELWEGVTSVSSAGKKKGRGKRVGRMRQRDLNRGQVLGEGLRSNFVWPGLNAPVIKGRQVIRQEELPPDPTKMEELNKFRDKMSTFRHLPLPTLQRGWSGNRFPGQSVGPPDPIGEYDFKDFDSRCVEFKIVTNMTGNLGRKHRFSAMVVVGNGNGLAGYAVAKANKGRSAIQQAKNRAAQKLQYIPLYKGHTVYHDMYEKEQQVGVFMHKKPEGFGLVCHRAIKSICELIGIKDLYAKVEANNKGNVQALTTAVFRALGNQETHQELADRLKLHVIERRSERDYFPEVVASPSDGAAKETVDPDEDLDFRRLYFPDQKVPHVVPPKPVYYYNTRQYKQYIKRIHRYRNQPHCDILRRAGMW
ncbi:unnamed protein product [Owenia fusiformis]|uniref:Small ribosomal subunit protein uS5m n=1 Tax=Owenia fusiformis TaxID=6347 RepID=A0A8J1XWR3_OWEFU|nr:unnamed protein product [Owenia fusiformis]